MSLVVEGRVTPIDRQRDPYLELAFEVPPGTARIEVRYRHDEGSVLDLGLADPSLEPFPATSGLRGWSGGARDRIEVGLHHATPGYLPGPIPAGTWRVLLGLAAVADEGCAYRIEIDLIAADAVATGSPPAREARRAPPRAPRREGSGWYRGDLQSHTHHSDARGTIEELRAAALARGLDYLAVTDHNTVSHHAPIAALGDDELLWLPGTEVTTYRGHANVWGTLGPVDFRIREPLDLETLVRHVHGRGGLFSVNHPKRAPGCIGCDWEYPVPEGIDCLEAWQGPWAFRNWESLERYDRLLRSGRRLTLVGGSDRHQPAGEERDPPVLRVGSPTTWLHLRTRSASELLDALRAGCATVSESPDGPFLEIELGGAPMGATVRADARHTARAHARGARGELLRWIGAHGVLREVLLDGDDVEDVCTLDPGGPFVRAEIVARDSLAARRRALRSIAAGRGLPTGLDEATVFAQPYRTAVSNPVYVR